MGDWLWSWVASMQVVLKWSLIQLSIDDHHLLHRLAAIALGDFDIPFIGQSRNK